MTYFVCNIVRALVTLFLGTLKKTPGPVTIEQNWNKPRKALRRSFWMRLFWSAGSHWQLCCSQSRVDCRLRRHFTETVGLFSPTTYGEPAESSCRFGKQVAEAFFWYLNRPRSLSGPDGKTKQNKTKLPQLKRHNISMQTLCVYMSMSLSSSTQAPPMSTQKTKKMGVFKTVLFGINDFFVSSPPLRGMPWKF